MNARYEDRRDEHWYCENCDEHHEGDCPLREISESQMRELQDAGIWHERRRWPHEEN